MPELPRVVVGPILDDQTRRLLAEPEMCGLLAGTAQLVEAEGGAFATELRRADALLLAGTWPAYGLRAEAAPRLRLVSVPATGYGHYVDAAALAARRVDVAFVPAYGADAIAEHALALALALAKNVVGNHMAVRNGGWPQPVSVGLRGRRAGVVGLGPIGLRAAELFAGIGMEVLVWSRRADPARLADTNARFADLDTIVSSCDVLSLHLASGPETLGLIDAALIERMRPGAILVNTARADLVDQDALAEGVRAGRLRYASDVLPIEPPASQHLALFPEEVLLSPHIAFNTEESSRALLAGALANVAAHLAGAPTNLVARPHSGSVAAWVSGPESVVTGTRPGR